MVKLNKAEERIAAIIGGDGGGEKGVPGVVVCLSESLKPYCTKIYLPARDNDEATNSIIFTPSEIPEDRIQQFEEALVNLKDAHAALQAVFVVDGDE